MHGLKKLSEENTVKYINLELLNQACISGQCQQVVWGGERAQNKEEQLHQLLGGHAGARQGKILGNFGKNKSCDIGEK